MILPTTHARASARVVVRRIGIRGRHRRATEGLLGIERLLREVGARALDGRDDYLVVGLTEIDLRAALREIGRYVTIARRNDAEPRCCWSAARVLATAD